MKLQVCANAREHHVKWNPRDYVRSPGLMRKFIDVRHGKVSQADLSTAMEQRAREYPKENGSRVIENLLAEQDRWLHSKTHGNVNISNDTTNRVEGFFGNLKVLTDHEIGNLQQLIRDIVVRTETLWSKGLTLHIGSCPDAVMRNEDALFGNAS